MFAIILKIVITVIMAGIGGWLSRMCGQEKPLLGYGLAQYVFALPYILLGFPNIFLCLLSYGFAVLGKRTGHGGGMDLGHSTEEPSKGRSLEKVEFLIYPWLFKRVSRYWYDFTLMSLTSLLSNIGACVSLIVLGFPILGIVFLAISTLIKPISYVIGWKMYPNFHSGKDQYLNNATEVGEFLNGALHYILIAITLLIIL